MSAVIRLNSLNFRPMDESDLTQIMALEHSAYLFPWSRTIFRDCMRVGYCCWVMERDDVLEAYGVMAVAAGECHILNLCVKPELQGFGIGRQLLEFLLDISRQHRADTVFLEVRPSNEKAKRLYLQSGFNEVGMRRNYYPAKNGREDAIIMARSLI